MERNCDEERNDNSVSTEQMASQNIANAIDELIAKGYITSRPILVGDVENEVADFANSIGNPLQNKSMYFTGGGITHALRDTKQNKGVAVDNEDFVSFPFSKSKMSIYYDTETKRYTYTDGKNKFIVEPNAKVKLKNEKEAVVSLITATKMRRTDEFCMDKYKKVK